MSVNDPIGDMLTRIRNAQERGKSKVSTPHSKLRENVLNVLQGEGFIRGYAVVQLGNNKAEIVEARPPRVCVGWLAADRLQWPWHFDPLDAQGCDVGCRRSHPQCGRRSSLHRVLRSHTCLVSERNQFPYRPA
jgi:Ribosomal protein S8